MLIFKFVPLGFPDEINKTALSGLRVCAKAKYRLNYEKRKKQTGRFRTMKIMITMMQNWRKTITEERDLSAKLMSEPS